MRKKRNRIFLSSILFFSIFIFSSCSVNNFFKLDLSDSIEYLETDSKFGYGDLMRNQDKFKKLEKKDFNLTNLKSNPENYIWLKIKFRVPNELKSVNLGLYIGHLSGAVRCWVNNNMIRMYGSFPPNEMSSGFEPQYYMFPPAITQPRTDNIIYLQIYTSAICTLSNDIYIAEQKDIAAITGIKTFLNSKINLLFAANLLLIFFIYSVLYIILKKTDENKSFMSFALLSLYTFHFLIPFFISEVPILKPSFLSYFTFIKISFGLGVFTTVYFASNFVIHYLDYKPSNASFSLRLIFWAVPTFTAFLLPDIKALQQISAILVVLSMAQFAFCIPFLFKAFKDEERRHLALELIFASLPVYTGIVLDIIVHGIAKQPSSPYLTIYGWQFSSYVFLYFLIKKLGQNYLHNKELQVQLSNLNTHLEDIVQVRTKELSEANSDLMLGIETVAHVQHNFLPQQVKSFRGWDLAITYRPLANNVSGDLYDYYATKSTLNGMGIFDVSGHGIPAGLMTILAKGIISQQFVSGLEQGLSMSEVLKRINSSYIKEKVNIENYITGLLFHFGAFDDKGVCPFEVSNAGHPYPLFYSTQEDRVIELKYHDLEKQYGLLGIDGLDISFPPVKKEAYPGDILVLFTDGLTESMNDKKVEFGKEKIMKMLIELKNESAVKIKDMIIHEFELFRGDEKPTDDFTLVVLKRTNDKDFLEEI